MAGSVPSSSSPRDVADQVDVSVVIPVRDGEATIRRAVESALGQEGVTLEVVVVDDGSSDGTLDRLAQVHDERLIVLTGPYAGVSAARNRGAAHARGAYLVFLDSDDYGLPGALHSLVEAAGESGVARGGVLVATETPDDDERFEEPGGTWLAGSYIIERDIFERIGGFDEHLQYSENHELSMRASAAVGHRPGRVDDPVVVLDRSRSGSSRPCRLAAIERILDKHDGALRSSHDRYARWLGLAAVESIRHRHRSRALRYAARSVMASPRSGRAWVRLASVAVWPVAARRHPRYRETAGE